LKEQTQSERTAASHVPGVQGIALFRKPSEEDAPETRFTLSFGLKQELIDDVVVESAHGLLRNLAAAPIGAVRGLVEVEIFTHRKSSSQ
jgi:hypothetical protein